MITCAECKKRCFPADPSKPFFNHKYGWRVPPLCDSCQKPQSERDVELLLETYGEESDSLRSALGKASYLVKRLDMIQAEIAYLRKKINENTPVVKPTYVNRKKNPDGKQKPVVRRYGYQDE